MHIPICCSSHRSGTSGVPVEHLLDLENLEWFDGYFDLPQNPVSGGPILLVPRRIVRLLPWINYDEYYGREFKMFMRPAAFAKARGWPGRSRRPRAEADAQAGRRSIEVGKPEVVKITRENLVVLDKYVTRKEKESPLAMPAFVTKKDLGIPDRPMADEFAARLTALPPGHAGAHEYQRLVYEILNYLFERS